LQRLNDKDHLEKEITRRTSSRADVLRLVGFAKQNQVYPDLLLSSW
jgi:hypothetical protein